MGIPDQEFYQPTFSPWRGYGDFPAVLARTTGRTVVGWESCWILYSLARQALSLDGEFWECGVYKGGTAAMLADIIARLGPAASVPEHRLRLFDTFSGTPEADPERDKHRQGDFADTSLGDVQSFLNHDDFVTFHEGMIPDTFAGLERSRIAIAHIDVDIYKSVMDCCEFIFPRLASGGFMVFDDYGFVTCPGARAAVDDYFRQTNVTPLVLWTGQALVFKGGVAAGAGTAVGHGGAQAGLRAGTLSRPAPAGGRGLLGRLMGGR